MSVGVNTIRQELTGSVMSSPTQTEIVANHRRAVRFFWCFLIGATTVSLIGNIEDAILRSAQRRLSKLVPPLFRRSLYWPRYMALLSRFGRARLGGCMAGA